MKQVKTLLLLISLLLLTGCGLETYDYNGSDYISRLESSAIDDMNENGAKVEVDNNQAFVELNEDTKKYEVYNTGTHKIDKKESTYDYYFVDLNKVKDVNLNTGKGFKLVDNIYSELTILCEGTYDYQINNVNSLTGAYLSVEDIVDYDVFVQYAVEQALSVAIIDLEKEYKELSMYTDKIVETALDKLKKIGISASITVKSITVDEASDIWIKSVDNNLEVYDKYIKNSTWLAADDSELQLHDGEFKWYQKYGEYEDNFQYGDYEFFIGDPAIKFITEDLKSYGITAADLETLFANNTEYDKSNFVAFNINLEGYTIKGETTTVNSPIYWYGFILKDNNNVQVVNMSSAVYYNFLRKLF